MKWIILILLLVFISGCSDSGISDSEAIEKVKPAITTYCDDLETLPATTICPKCWSYGNEQMYDALEYEIVKEGNLTIITTDVRVVYGSNTHDAYKHAEFRLDNDGGVFYENIEEATCLE